MTIVTDDQGNILGAVQGHSLSDKQGDLEASVSFAPGHKTHQVDVDDDMASIDDADEFQKRLQQHLTQP
ncbi:MAG: hypothetical protein ACEQSK_18365 [Sphingomonadaceae bacterium]